jgi:hypothetical protein
VSQSVDLTTMKTRVCALCDIPDPGEDTPITSTVMLEFLKAACGLLSGLVKENAGELYFTNAQELAALAGISLVSLPDNFSDLVSLTWVQSDGTERALVQATVDQLRAYPSAWADCDTDEIRYRLVGEALELFPTPDAAYTLKAYYSTGLYPTSMESSFYARDGWDTYVVYQTCVMVRARQQRDASDFGVLLNGLDGQSGLTRDIKKQLKRDRAGIRTVRDMRNTPVLTYPRRLQ